MAQTQQTQFTVAFCLFGVAYALLPFGLLLPLFRMKVTVFGMTMTDEALSTFGTIHKLWSENHMLPAMLIVFFSVLVPLVKLAMVLVQSRKSTGESVDHWLVDLLRSTARWATVDAFVAVILSTIFAQTSAVDLELKAGFYAFLAYCLIAVMASQALPAESGLPTHTAADASSTRRRIGLALLMLSAIALTAGLKLPCMDVEVSMLSLSHQVAVVEMQRSAVVSLLQILVAVVPFAEVALSLAGHPLSEALSDWAMGDVLAAALIVSALLLKTLPGTSASFLLGFWCLILHAGLAGLARRCLRPAADSGLAKTT